MVNVKSVVVVSSVLGFLLGTFLAAWWGAGPEEVW